MAILLLMVTTVNILPQNVACFLPRNVACYFQKTYDHDKMIMTTMKECDA